MNQKLRFLRHSVHYFAVGPLAFTLGISGAIQGCGSDDPQPAAPTAAADSGKPTQSVTAPEAPLSTVDRCRSLSAEQIEQYATAVETFFTSARSKLSVLGSTLSPLGAVLDWIDPNSQSPTHKDAAVPALPDVPELLDPALTTLETGLFDPWLAANPNLVPVPRIDILSRLAQAWNCMGLDDVLSKYGDAHDQSVPPESGGTEPTPDQLFAHHYANTRQFGAVYGSSAVLKVEKPLVWQDSEFSLAQVAVANRSAGPIQTVEVGWQVSRNEYGDDLPHIFVYYTTNAYEKPGDYLGGYNQEVYGWEQVSHRKHPRDALVLGSELAVTVHMYQGNWWVGINGEWMGFFPGSLFLPNGLGSVGSEVSWYGEIVDYRADKTPTYTAMGNGFFAGPNTAYIRNIVFESLNQYSIYAPTVANADKPNCYSIESHSNSGSSWGSYFYYGGPGKEWPLCL